MRNLLLKIVDTFTAPQGEGIHLGQLAHFIRFADCNLNCPWCDEPLHKGSGQTCKLDDVLHRFNLIVCKNIVLTGGEPLLNQKTIYAVINQLLEKNLLIWIETNGTFPFLWSSVDTQRADNIWIAVAPKPQTKYFIHPNLIPNEIKLVVDENLTNKVIINIYHRFGPRVPLWLQPCDGPFLKDSLIKIQNILNTCNLPNLRFGIQAHKTWEVK